MRTFTVFLLLLILIGCGQTSSPLVADFSIEQSDELTVKLDASSSSEALLYSWDFGDGSQAEGEQVEHSFADYGSYPIKLTLTNAAGDSESISKEFTLIKRTEIEAFSQKETDSQAETAFVIDNTGSTDLAWELLISNAETNPQAGDWFTLNPVSGKLAAGDQATITLVLNANLKAGTYGATLVLKYAGGQQRFAVAALVDSQAAPQTGFALSTDYAIEPALTLIANQGGIVEVAIQRFEGFNEAVSLSLVGAANGFKAQFEPATVTGNSTILTLEADASIVPDSYSLTLKGESPSGKTASTNILVNVINPNSSAGFTASLTPPSLNLNAGATSTLSLSLKRTPSFTAAVQITESSDLQDLQVTYSENPVQQATDISLIIPANAAAGTYLVNFWAQSTEGPQSSSVNLSLTIKENDSGSARVTGSVQTDNSLIPISDATNLNSSLFTAATLEKKAYVDGQILVKFKPMVYQALSLQNLSNDEQKESLLASLKVASNGLRFQSVQTLGAIELLSFDSEKDVLELAQELAQDPSVAYAEPNYYLYTQGIPNDSLVEQQWHSAAAGLPVAWTQENGSSHEVIVAVIDSGFDLSHPDLSAKFVQGYDFCGSANCAAANGDADASNGNPSNNHGTHVAGIVAATGNNNQGVAGVAYGTKVKVLPIKIFDDFGEGATIANFIDAIHWAVGIPIEGVPDNQNPASIINMSLGAYFDSVSVQDVINEARNAGALLLAATGNDGVNRVMSPAAANNVLGVGSIGTAFTRSCFSNYGSDPNNGVGKVDLLAPGGNGRGCANEGILSTFPNGTYGELAGTSMATPVAAGVAALMLSQTPALTVEQLEQQLLASTYYDASYMNESEYGAGILRADLALGLPGPGSSVTISADGASDSALDTVILDLEGGSDSFELTDLVADRYVLEANAAGSRFQLKATASVNLTEGETETRTLLLK